LIDELNKSEQAHDFAIAGGDGEAGKTKASSQANNAVGRCQP